MNYVIVNQTGTEQVVNYQAAKEGDDHNFEMKTVELAPFERHKVKVPADGVFRCDLPGGVLLESEAVA